MVGGPCSSKFKDQVGRHSMVGPRGQPGARRKQFNAKVNWAYIMFYCDRSKYHIGDVNWAPGVVASPCDLGRVEEGMCTRVVRGYHGSRRQSEGVPDRVSRKAPDRREPGADHLRVAVLPLALGIH